MGSRWKRKEFFAKIAEMDEAESKQMLWAVYWRGTAPVRERIEELVEPERKEARQRTENVPPNAKAVLAEVTEFAALAKAGAYMGGDCRVSPKERAGWRLTFRRLASDAQKALRGADVKRATKALYKLIGLVHESERTTLFRSQDPAEAARFVVSDAVAAIWAAYRDQYGVDEMLKVAVDHLLRWESVGGWTRFGEGWVAEQETTLTSILVRYLTIPDLWGVAARYTWTVLTTSRRTRMPRSGILRRPPLPERRGSATGMNG